MKIQYLYCTTPNNKTQAALVVTLLEAPTLRFQEI
jgi:hypothetical protein